MIYLILPIYIPDMDNYQMTIDCENSLFDKTSNFKLITIRNGGMVYSPSLREEIFLDFPGKLGYARAVNIGWRVCEELPDCEYVGVLNNDLIFHDNWLQPLIDHLDNKTAACASYDQDVPEDLVSDHIWSSCFLMKNETRKKIGYFDSENLPFRYHDQDYWMRAKSMGLNFKRVGASRVDHKESSTYKKMTEKNNEGSERQIVLNRWGVDMAQYYQP